MSHLPSAFRSMAFIWKAVSTILSACKDFFEYFDDRAAETTVHTKCVFVPRECSINCNKFPQWYTVGMEIDFLDGVHYWGSTVKQALLVAYFYYVKWCHVWSFATIYSTCWMLFCPITLLLLYSIIVFMQDFNALFHASDQNLHLIRTWNYGCECQNVIL